MPAGQGRDPPRPKRRCPAQATPPCAGLGRSKCRGPSSGVRGGGGRQAPQAGPAAPCHSRVGTPDYFYYLFIVVDFGAAMGLSE